MGNIIEEPKKCELHKDTFLTPSKTNPSRLVCQECINQRISKMVITKKKNKKAQVKSLAQPEIDIPNKVELDFTPYTGIRDALLQSASVNFRTIENEILFTLNEYLKSKVITK